MKMPRQTGWKNVHTLFYNNLPATTGGSIIENQIYIVIDPALA